MVMTEIFIEPSRCLRCIMGNKVKRIKQQIAENTFQLDMFDLKPETVIDIYDFLKEPHKLINFGFILPTERNKV